MASTIRGVVIIGIAALIIAFALNTQFAPTREAPPGEKPVRENPASSVPAERVANTLTEKPAASPSRQAPVPSSARESPAPMRSAFPGDDALSLAGERYAQSSKRDAEAAIGRIMQHLDLPQDRRDRFAYIPSATFRKADDYAEFVDLSETVLIAAKSVKISFAKNVAVISNGTVDIAHGSGVLVIAAGSIRLAHESGEPGVRPPGGLYITKGSFELSHGAQPAVYAVKGASTGFSSPVAYNTDVRLGSGSRSTAFTRGPLFREEPLRTPSGPTMAVNSGELMPFEGQRCKFNVELVDLFTRLLPMARRDADCPRLQSAKVQCENDGAPPASDSRERWTFVGCGNRVDYSVSGQTNAASIGPAAAGAGIPQPSHTSISINRAPAPAGAAGAAPAPFIPPGGKLGEDRNALYQQALAHMLRGELLEARAAYQAAFNLTGNDPYALSNIASIDRQIASVDAKVAPYSKIIDGGNARTRDFANRGLAYVRAGDVSRGIKDLNQASGMNNADAQIQVDLAQAYLLANRLEEAHGTAHEVTARDPRNVGAYEISAWSQLLMNTPDLAYKAAFSSLVEAQPWSKARFASEKAAYRVLAGYFGLRACNARPKANAWIRQWAEFMSPNAWPEALALHLAGELDESAALEVATALKPKDAGLALADARSFLALEELYAETGDRQKKAMNEFFRDDYGAGRTLPWLLRTRLTTPSQQPRLRRASEMQCVFANSGS